MKPPELNPETESLPTRRSPEGPDPPVLTEVAPPNDSPLDLESVEKKLDAGRYKSVVSLKSHPNSCDLRTVQLNTFNQLPRKSICFIFADWVVSVHFKPFIPSASTQHCVRTGAIFL